MKIPHPDSVDDAELAAALRLSADTMAIIDGDRDHMSRSRLMCGQVEGAMRLMRIAAAKLDQR